MTAAAQIEATLGKLGIDYGFAATHLASGASIALNAHALFPTASVFKIPVMVEVYRQARAGAFRMTDRLPLTEPARSIGSGVMQKLDGGAALTVRDLVMLMIIISDNTATQMLVSLVGPQNVTATMRRLGLANIHVVMDLLGLFIHAYNLPQDPVPSYGEIQAIAREAKMDYGARTFACTPENTTSSAADMAKLVELIHTNQAGTPEDCADMMVVLKSQQLRDRVPRYLPVAAVGNKTGTFRGVRNDAGIILRGPDDAITFGLFTFDRTDVPYGNPRPLVERNILVNNAMADVGQILWDSFAK